MDVIRLKGVSKEYKRRAVLHDVNLTIESGDILGVIGQSGSGKTTLLNMIAGFIEPSDGEVTYVSNVTQKENSLHRNLHKIKHHIGFTPQHNSFYPKLTVKENLWHFGRMYNISKEALATNIRNLLNFTHLVDFQQLLAENLSGGMQKRLDISCSLVHKPKILILDEPTADLDPILQREILHLIEEVNKQGVTVIIASHQLDSVEDVCNKVAVVHKGTVHSYGLLEEVRKPYLRDHFTIHIRPGQQKETIIAKVKDLAITKLVDRGSSLVIYPENVEQALRGILAIVQEENLNLNDIHLLQPSLNEIFQRIAKGE